MIGATGEVGEFVHDVLHDGRAGEIEGIAGFASLEEDVGVLRGSTEDGVVRTKSALAMGANELLIEEGAEGVVGDGERFVDFVRGAETVEEMHEGDTGFEGSDVRDQGEVTCFLHRVRREHGVAGGAASHDVRVVAKDGESVCGDGAGGDVDDVGGKFACDLEEVGDHEQEALGGSEGGAKGTGLEGAMHGAGGSALALHLGDERNGAPDVLTAFFAPLVGPLGHGGRGSNRVNGDDLREAISDQGGGFISIENGSLLLVQGKAPIVSISF